MPCVSCEVHSAGGRHSRCFRCRSGLSPVAITEFDIRTTLVSSSGILDWTLQPDAYVPLMRYMLARQRDA